MGNTFSSTSRPVVAANDVMYPYSSGKAQQKHAQTKRGSLVGGPAQKCGQK